MGHLVVFIVVWAHLPGRDRHRLRAADMLLLRIQGEIEVLFERVFLAAAPMDKVWHAFMRVAGARPELMNFVNDCIALGWEALLFCQILLLVGQRWLRLLRVVRYLLQAEPLSLQLMLLSALSL